MVKEVSKNKTPKGKTTKTIAKKPAKPTAKKPTKPGAKIAKKAIKKPDQKTTNKKKPTSTKTKSKRSTKKEQIDEEIAPGDARKFFKIGQKHITPPKGDGTRGFYESLLEENPYSLISIKYSIEYGVLSGIKHREIFAFYKKLQELGAYKGTSGGIKSQFKKEKLEKLFQTIRSKINNEKIINKTEKAQ